jgi:hypothetical protein
MGENQLLEAVNLILESTQFGDGLKAFVWITEGQK